VARSFNGSSDEIAVASTFPVSANITIQAWVKLASVSGVQNIVTRDESNRYFIFRTNGVNLQLVTFDLNAANAYTATGSTTLSTGTWYHVAGTCDGTNTKVWVNGAQDGTIASAADNIQSVSGADTVQFGDRIGAAFLNGTLAEVAIHKVALGANELLASAKGALPHRIQPTNLLGYWPLYGIGSPEPDFSGNGRGGTLTGTAAANHAPVSVPGSEWWNASAPLIGVSAGGAPAFKPEQLAFAPMTGMY
jgi:hypothetical protein